MTGSEFGARLAAVDFEAPEPEGADTGFIPAEEAERAAEEAEYIGPGEFWQGVRFAFDAGGMFTGLQSLPVAEAEEASGRAASDALYRIIRRYPAVARWILGPQSALMGDLMAIGAFAAPKVMAVRAEIEARSKAAQRPANRNAAPEPEAERPEGARPEPEAQPIEDDIDLTVRAAA